MTARDMHLWAKEECLDAVDEFWRVNMPDGFDERRAAKKARDMVARLLKLDGLPGPFDP
jgi:hypothetical protein